MEGWKVGWKFILSVSSLFILLYILPFELKPVDPKKKMIETAVLWGRLQEFPKDVKEFKIDSVDNMFAPEIYGEFKLEQLALKKWVKESPGLQDAKVTITKGITYYDIKPGEGAMSAEVIVNYLTGEVKFKMVWS